MSGHRPAVRTTEQQGERAEWARDPEPAAAGVHTHPGRRRACALDARAVRPLPPPSSPHSRQKGRTGRTPERGLSVAPGSVSVKTRSGRASAEKDHVRSAAAARPGKCRIR
ncbi:hypothetical protein GCM10010500_61310 [Streptomyces nigrescens]|nr:hypothetical protein GCM10010500_61310 [Streptomyces libani subsp. libani]